MKAIFDIQSLLKAVAAGKRPKYLFFWGHRAPRQKQVAKQCLSQWWPSAFEIDSIEYPTAEHFMMAEKARLFNSPDIRSKILTCPTPSAAKQLGRTIPHYKEEVWRRHRFDIVVQGNTAKFLQNEELKIFLFNTRDRVLVEASPVDKIWGIGLAADDPGINNPENWKGLNLLGFALMKVRAGISVNCP